MIRGGGGARGAGRYSGALGRGDLGSRRVSASLGTRARLLGTLGRRCWEEAERCQGEACFAVEFREAGGSVSGRVRSRGQG